jgi:predicted TIM-barrel fold metal-dependent hydrolase
MYRNTQGNMSSMIQDERKMNIEQLIDNMNAIGPELKGLDGGNFMLFNEQLDWENLPKLKDCLSQFIPNVSFTQLFDFRTTNWKEQLDKMTETGVQSIKFHSYVQEIAESDFNIILEISKEAEKKNLAICIDASYGSNRLYDFDNLKLVAFLSQHIQKSPIIILHSGGARIFDAMLIADSTPNVFLETSFSLEYYKGSSLQKDMLYAYKKIGADKVLYASDYPAVGSLQESINNQIKWLGECKFSDSELEKIFFQNSKNIFQ